jgi:hypothetical protein
MSELEELTRQVADIADSIRSGKTDPLSIRLTEPYQRLQQLAAKIDRRLDIDEMLNDALGSKVTRVQEMARVLGTPELYVDKLRSMSTKRLASLLRHAQAVKQTHVSLDSLDRSMERIMRMIDLHSQRLPDDVPPTMSGIPSDFVFASESSIFLEELSRFVASMQVGRAVRIDDLLTVEDLEEFLRRFLFVIVLISKGMVSYDARDRTVTRVES